MNPRQPERLAQRHVGRRELLLKVVHRLGDVALGLADRGAWLHFVCALPLFSL